tara:strand:+ start:149 stop:628 length:480 start_codon:yes stop_codon:yes gene_type:complete
MDSRIFLAGAFVSLISILNFPIGFYTFVRIVVSLCAVYGAYYFSKDKKGIWIILALIAIFYNPFIPIYLYEKSLWIFINLITCLIFIYSFHLSTDNYRIVFIHGGKIILLSPIIPVLLYFLDEGYFLGALQALIILEIVAIPLTLIWNWTFNKKSTLWM